MKRVSGRNMAVTNTAILLFDLIMLLVSALLYRQGQIGFDGVVIPTLALFSSFGPTIALSALGSNAAKYLCSGQPRAGHSGRNRRRSAQIDRPAGE